MSTGHARTHAGRAEATTMAPSSTASSRTSWCRAATRQGRVRAAKGAHARPASRLVGRLCAQGARTRALRACSIYGGKFQDEITRELKHTGAGILSMANAGPNTNGSQFFITLAPTPFLDGKHTVFGRISSGLAVIKRMGVARTHANDRPVDPVRIVSAGPANAGLLK